MRLPLLELALPQLRALAPAGKSATWMRPPARSRDAGGGGVLIVLSARFLVEYYLHRLEHWPDVDEGEVLALPASLEKERGAEAPLSRIGL